MKYILVQSLAGHMYELTNECINMWNDKLICLSLSLLPSLSLKLNKLNFFLNK